MFCIVGYRYGCYSVMLRWYEAEVGSDCADGAEDLDPEVADEGACA